MVQYGTVGTLLDQKKIDFIGSAVFPLFDVPLFLLKKVGAIV